MQNRFDTAFRILLNPGDSGQKHTPSDVVYSEDSMRLLHYRPAVEGTLPVPLLVVPSPMAHYSLMDLMPGKSLVGQLVAQGFDVYLLDWGVHGPKNRYVTFDQYINGYLRRAVQQVATRSGQPRISLLGYSMGGTISAIGTALFGDKVQNLVQIAAPVNFHDDGVLSQWTRKDRFNVDMVVDTLGVMPPSLMEASFRMLAPTAQLMQQFMLAERFDDLEVMQDLMAIQSWIGNSTLFIGEAYRKYMKECYQANNLVQRRLVIDRQRVDLKRITCALLNVTAAKDRFCPPQSAAVLNDLVSSEDRTLLELPGSHVGLIIGRSAVEQLWPQLTSWLRARSACQAPVQDSPPVEQPPVAQEVAPVQEPSPVEEPVIVQESAPIEQSLASEELPVAHEVAPVEQLASVEAPPVAQETTAATTTEESTSKPRKRRTTRKKPAEDSPEETR